MPRWYTEQLSIDKQLTLKGVTSSAEDLVVIVPPLTGLVQNATNVDTGLPIAAQT